MYSAVCKLVLDFRRKIVSKRAYEPKKVTIGVGSCLIGGAAKTEVVSYLMSNLHDRNPCTVVKGYKGTLFGPILVTDENRSPSLIGDEACMLYSRNFKVIVSRNKKEGVRLAEKEFNLIIVDDSFQHVYLKPHLSLLTIPCEDLNLLKQLNQEKFFPFGPLRDSFKSCVDVASAVLLINRQGNQDYPIELLKLPQDKPVFCGFYHTDLPIQNSNVTLVSSIARSAAFENAVEAQNSVQKKFIFRDHFQYLQRDIDFIESSSPSQIIVTTEKDWVKIKDLKTSLTWLVVKTKLKMEQAFLDFLDQQINAFCS